MKKIPQVQEVYGLLEMGTDSNDEFQSMTHDYQVLLKDTPNL